MDAYGIGIIAFCLLFSVYVLFQLFGQGEIVGTLTAYYHTFVGGTKSMKVVVKRVAPTAKRKDPKVQLHGRVSMAANMYPLSAVQARQLAEVIEATVAGQASETWAKRIAGAYLHWEPGPEGRIQLGVEFNIGDDGLVGFVDDGDARKLAEMLRIAAAPGATVLQARINARNPAMLPPKEGVK
jgi:hypothetical protein